MTIDLCHEAVTQLKDLIGGPTGALRYRGGPGVRLFVFGHQGLLSLRGVPTVPMSHFTRPVPWQRKQIPPLGGTGSMQALASVPGPA